MNNRQKAGVGGLIAGILTLAVNILVVSTAVTPVWVDMVLNVLGVVFPAIGLVVNLPANTNPQ